MREKKTFSPPMVGGSWLISIFAVLCMTVFALLSLSTVQSDRRLADASVQAVIDYYGADTQAQTLFARLRAGETVPGVEILDGIYVFDIPISQRQTLMVELLQEEDRWTVLRWQAVVTEDSVDEGLELWKGLDSKEEIP